MQTLFEDLDFTGSIRDIQFTRRARRQLANVIRSGDLEQMDAAQILAFLLSRLELVSFHDPAGRTGRLPEGYPDCGFHPDPAGMPQAVRPGDA